jgi:hypothetical protein
MHALQDVNALLKEVATTIVTATAIIGATVALFHKVRRLFRRGNGPRP